MGELSPIHWLIVLAIIVLLFGGKKIPEVMKGLGEGIRHFKDGMSGNANTTTAPPSNVPPPSVPVTPAPTVTEEKK
jgi:sec-independent protein translocase protein TatA